MSGQSLPLIMATTESSLDLWADRTIASAAPTARNLTSPEVVEALSRSSGAGQLFDLRHDAVQLVNQRVVAMLAKSYD